MISCEDLVNGYQRRKGDHRTSYQIKKYEAYRCHRILPTVYSSAQCVWLLAPCDQYSSLVPIGKSFHGSIKFSFRNITVSYIPVWSYLSGPLPQASMSASMVWLRLERCQARWSPSSIHESIGDEMPKQDQKSISSSMVYSRKCAKSVPVQQESHGLHFRTSWAQLFASQSMYVYSTWCACCVCRALGACCRVQFARRSFSTCCCSFFLLSARN